MRAPSSRRLLPDRREAPHAARQARSARGQRGVRSRLLPASAADSAPLRERSSWPGCPTGWAWRGGGPSPLPPRHHPIHPIVGRSIAMPETSAIVQDADESAESGERPGGPPPPHMIGVDQLAAHPGNVRADLELTAEFCASVAETGVRIPLLVTHGEGGGGYRVIEGHRRLAAALKTGLSEVPCVLDPSRAGDEAGQFLDMVVANSGGQRRNFTPVEEAAALFAAHEAGASRTRIRRVDRPQGRGDQDRAGRRAGCQRGRGSRWRRWPAS